MAPFRVWILVDFNNNSNYQLFNNDIQTFNRNVQFLITFTFYLASISFIIRNLKPKLTVITVLNLISMLKLVS